MTTPFKPSAHPRPPRRRRSTKSASNAATHPAMPSAVDPQLVPLLDLLADLIAKEVWRHRNGSHACLQREASEAHPAVAAHGASTVVVETPGNSAPIPMFPGKSHPECHQIPTTIRMRMKR